MANFISFTPICFSFNIFFFVSISHSSITPKLTDLTAGVCQSKLSPSTGRHYRSLSWRHRSSPPHRNRHIPLSLWHARVSLLGTWNWRNSAGSPVSRMIAEWMPHEYGEWCIRGTHRGRLIISTKDVLCEFEDFGSSGWFQQNSFFFLAQGQLLIEMEIRRQRYE